MSNRRAHLSIPDPFPAALLRELDFGSADGHRDDIAEEAFILTSSVKRFLLNKQSIVVGAIGTGKSTLFRLLKNRSKELEQYKNDLIVPLEEALSFSELNDFAIEYFPDKEKNALYQLLWKFNVLSKISIAISKLPNFPKNPEEKLVNKFLIDTDSSDSYSDVVRKIRNLLTKARISIQATVSDIPISFDAGLVSQDGEARRINLEEVQRAVSGSIEKREFKTATVIIDKIDKFVAGVEYQVQRSFLTSLLELDDDLSADKHINLKIFLRSDLFERLDFSGLGYDKVIDNVVYLKWSNDETLRFLATRISVALRNANIATVEQLLQATDLSEFELSIKEKLLLSPIIPNVIKKIFSNEKRHERATSLYRKFDKSIITKLFPRKCIHYSQINGAHEQIGIFDFLETHFIDGNEVCTPRYMLTFLREVVENTASYFDENPDQISELSLIGKDYEWDLFKRNCVYYGYLSSKDIYIRNIATVEARWTQHFNVFLSKKGNKTRFDFKWIKGNVTSISDEEAVDFLSFLQVIGFLRITDPHQDIRKRGYELPILYRMSPELSK